MSIDSLSGGQYSSSYDPSNYGYGSSQSTDSSSSSGTSTDGTDGMSKQEIQFLMKMLEMMLQEEQGANNDDDDDDQSSSPHSGSGSGSSGAQHPSYGGGSGGGAGGGGYGGAGGAEHGGNGDNNYQYAPQEKTYQPTSANESNNGASSVGGSNGASSVAGSSGASSVAGSSGASSVSGSTGSDSVSGSSSSTSSGSNIGTFNVDPGTTGNSSATSYNISNSSNAPETIYYTPGGEDASAAKKVATLQPGESLTATTGAGTSGVFSVGDSQGNFNPNATRMEVETDADGKSSSNNWSVIDGDNASGTLSDGQGKSLGFGSELSAAEASGQNIVSTDAAGDKQIAGYYDGSTSQMQAAGNWEQSQGLENSTYVHPNDDTNQGGSNNPMTMAMDTSRTYDVSFGAA